MNQQYETFLVSGGENSYCSISGSPSDRASVGVKGEAGNEVDVDAFRRGDMLRMRRAMSTVRGGKWLTMIDSFQ